MPVQLVGRHQSTDNHDTISIYLWKTTTEESDKILASGTIDQQIFTYKEVVNSWNIPCREQLIFDSYEDEVSYNMNDLGGCVYKGKPPTTIQISPTVEHFEELGLWLFACEENGYTVDLEVV